MFTRPGARLSRRVALASLALLVFAASLASAGEGRRARLSADLERHLSSGAAAAVDVIVSGSREEIAALAARHGVEPKRWLFDGAVIRVTPGTLAAMTADEAVAHLSGDVAVRGTMAVTGEAIGADQVWRGLEGLTGYDGRGIGIALIDSGVARLPAIRRRIVADVDFTTGGGAGEDAFGHGTHVAGIIAAGATDDPAIPEGYSGVAPGAHLVNLKVLDAEGVGTVSDVVEAIDWAIAHRTQFNIRIINLSLGHPVFEPADDDPLCRAVQRAVSNGIVVVAAAGNVGKTEDGKLVVGGIDSPGNSPYAITVGALNTKGTAFRSDDVVATYSSRGPTLYDWVLKPDVVAPGNKIVSLEAPGSAIIREYPALHQAGQGAGAYMQMSGTSMSAAVVSGVAALVLQANPQLDPVEVKAALQLGATFIPETGLIACGAGSVDAITSVRIAAFGPKTNDDAFIAGETVTPTGIAFWREDEDPGRPDRLG